MVRPVVIVGALALSGAWVSVGDAGAQSAKAVVVKMVDVSATDYRFVPAAFTVHAGDTVRFEQTGTMPHNVEFKQTPTGAKLGSTTMGPFLTKAGQTYDVVIDARFVVGEYPYVCTPHTAMGMKGTMTVTPRGGG